MSSTESGAIFPKFYELVITDNYYTGLFKHSYHSRKSSYRFLIKHTLVGKSKRHGVWN